MNHPIRAVFALSLVLACARPGPAQTSSEPQNASQPWMQFEKELGLQTTYSVDMTIQVMGMNMESRTVRSGGKTRTEMTMPFMNLRLVALETPQGSRSLFPDKKKYVVNDSTAGAAAAAAASNPKIEDLGTETYEGVACLKRRLTLVQQGITSEMIMLFSPAQKNMPVKMTMTATVPSVAGQPAMPIQSVVLFKNYDFSTPDDSLFAIPPDYAQAGSMQEIMMESMGGLGDMLKQMQALPPPE